MEPAGNKRVGSTPSVSVDLGSLTTSDDMSDGFIPVGMAASEDGIVLAWFCAMAGDSGGLDSCVLVSLGLVPGWGDVVFGKEFWEFWPASSFRPVTARRRVDAKE